MAGPWTGTVAFALGPAAADPVGAAMGRVRVPLDAAGDAYGATGAGTPVDAADGSGAYSDGVWAAATRALRAVVTVQPPRQLVTVRTVAL